jgi:hypothetical protein
MKLFKKIVLVLIVVFITSCEKNSDTPKVDEVSIAGKWKLISYVEDGKEYMGDWLCDEFIIMTESTIGVEHYSGENCDYLYNPMPEPYSIENNIINGFYAEEPYITVEILEKTESILKLKESSVEEVVIDPFTAYAIWEKQ